MDGSEIPVCPFCGFKDESDYQIMLHVEIHHSEDGSSPFAVKDTPSQMKTNEMSEAGINAFNFGSAEKSTSSEYLDCPHKCGERVTASDMKSHTDFHFAENMAFDDGTISSGSEPAISSQTVSTSFTDITNNFTTSISTSIRNYSQMQSTSTNRTRKRQTPSWKELFLGSPIVKKQRSPSKISSSNTGDIKRLGRAELGPYAHEKRMPAWLLKLLEDGSRVNITSRIGSDGRLIRVESVTNETSGLIPVLARLSQIDPNVARAFYCSSEVYHVAKLAREGGFCGYRNIQMLISWIRNAQGPNYQQFAGKQLPSILSIQDDIEDAWERGFNSAGKIETGGIRMTRKYIGTPEAQAYFLSLAVPCEAISFSNTSEADACDTMINSVCEYFDDESVGDDMSKVTITGKAPIYFQHQGHSMTIVGVEISVKGMANLIVFDPMFNPSATMKKLADGSTVHCKDPAKLMKAHRRGTHYLSKYKAFELLKIPNGDHKALNEE